MTYRELILYILENHLEDEEVFKNGTPAGFQTVEETAVKFEVGVATVQVWIERKMLPSITLGKVVYIPANAKPEGTGWVYTSNGKKVYL